MRRGRKELEAAGGPGAIAPNGKPVESVWDFPRPPIVERVDWRIRVLHGGVTIVDAPHAMRVLETSQAPAYYVAPEFVDDRYLVEVPRRSMCEWKGAATYADVVVGDRRAQEATWTYRDPTPRFEPIRRPLGVLRTDPRRVLGRRRTRRRQRGQLLRRLDHRQRHRPVQGRCGHHVLVTPAPHRTATHRPADLSVCV